MRVLATLSNPNIPAKPSNSLILTRPLRGQTFALQSAHQGLVVFTERNLLRTRTHYWHSTLRAGSCRLRGQGSVRASRHILRCLAPSPPSRVCEKERSYSPPAMIERQQSGRRWVASEESNQVGAQPLRKTAGAQPELHQILCFSVRACQVPKQSAPPALPQPVAPSRAKHVSYLA